MSIDARNHPRRGRAHSSLAGLTAALIVAILTGSVAPLASAEDDSLRAKDRRAALRRINSTLEAWIRVSREDAQYLVLDRQAAVLRLQHGSAVLRSCPVTADDLVIDGQPVNQALSRRLRDYRRHHPYVQRQPGPLDWDQYLATDATDECALEFSSGLLLYAAALWKQRSPSGRSIQLDPVDLRALYNSVDPGTPFLILPVGWDRLHETYR